MPGRALICVLLILLLVVLALLLAGPGAALVLGGAVRTPRPPAPHIVVDTLNLAGWRSAGERPTQPSIVETIDKTAAALKLRWPGRVMYVVKDRESQFNDQESRDSYRAAAERNGVYVYVAEQYQDPPSGSALLPVRSSKQTHAAQGRDDFYVALLAHRWRCEVLTEDRMRDFDQFRADVPPFHVYEYAFWRELPAREYVKPAAAAHARLRKPRRVGFAEVLDPAQNKTRAQALAAERESPDKRKKGG